MAEFGESAAARTAPTENSSSPCTTRRPVHGYTWLHGLKQGRMVHVAAVDAPVTVGDIKQIAMEFRKTLGKGKDSPTSASVDVLGWDFAFEVNEVSRQDAARAGIDMRFIRIPREVLDDRAVTQGDVRLLRLAALVRRRPGKKPVTLTLSDFVIPAGRRTSRKCSGRLQVVSVDRLLGGRLGQPWRHVSQRMADLSDAERKRN